MLAKVKDAVTSEKTKTFAREFAIIVVTGIAINLTIRAGLRGIDYAAQKIAEGRTE